MRHVREDKGNLGHSRLDCSHRVQQACPKGDLTRLITMKARGSGRRSANFDSGVDLYIER